MACVPVRAARESDWESGVCPCESGEGERLGEWRVSL